MSVPSTILAHATLLVLVLVLLPPLITLPGHHKNLLLLLLSLLHPPAPTPPIGSLVAMLMLILPDKLRKRTLPWLLCGVGVRERELTVGWLVAVLSLSLLP